MRLGLVRLNQNCGRKTLVNYTSFCCHGCAEKKSRKAQDQIILNFDYNVLEEEFKIYHGKSWLGYIEQERLAPTEACLTRLAGALQLF